MRREFVYPVVLTPDGEAGGFVVSFPDLPDAARSRALGACRAGGAGGRGGNSAAAASRRLARRPTLTTASRSSDRGAYR